MNSKIDEHTDQIKFLFDKFDERVKEAKNIMKIMPIEKGIKD